ncbi:hypothetical protein F4860DRAFT_120565 [Xylaria cubensis]|nr:hypothetical protein F4860DRAFT_120565 [Xylaria cubensis]
MDTKGTSRRSMRCALFILYSRVATMTLRFPSEARMSSFLRSPTIRIRCGCISVSLFQIPMTEYHVTRELLSIYVRAPALNTKGPGNPKIDICVTKREMGSVHKHGSARAFCSARAFMQTRLSLHPPTQLRSRFRVACKCNYSILQSPALVGRRRCGKGVRPNFQPCHARTCKFRPSFVPQRATAGNIVYPRSSVLCVGITISCRS